MGSDRKYKEEKDRRGEHKSSLIDIRYRYLPKCLQYEQQVIITIEFTSH